MGDHPDLDAILEEPQLLKLFGLLNLSRGLGDVYKRQQSVFAAIRKIDEVFQGDMRTAQHDAND